MGIRKAIVGLLFTAGVTSSAYCADLKSVREAFVASDSVRQLYAIDDNFTMVVPTHTSFQGVISPEFISEFQALCPESLQVAITEQVTDPITGKVTDQNSFKPFDGKQITQGLSCPGRFKVTNLFGETRSSSNWGTFFFVKSFIIQHEAPEPFVYKNEVVPPIDKITLPPEGPVGFLKEKEVESAVGRGVLGTIKGVGKLFGADVSKGRFDDEDLVQYLLALSKKTGSNARFVVNAAIRQNNIGVQIVSGRSYSGSESLVEVSAKAAFVYAYAGKNPPPNEAPRKEWFVAIEGKDKFVVAVKHKPKGAPDSYVAHNRGLEGLRFKPL